MTNELNNKIKSKKEYNRFSIRSWSLVIGLAIILIIAALSILAPFITPHPYYQQNISKSFLPPFSQGYLFGTDQFGRDIFSRVLYGGRMSLEVAILATGVSVIIGVLVGGFAGYFGKKVDLILSIFINITWSFPLLLICLVLVAMRGPSLASVMIGIGIVAWSGIARVVRGEILSLRERDFIKASEALGISKFKILFVHIIPNIFPSILVLATVYMATSILIESSLSFLGIGAQPPLSSWGTMLNEGRMYLMKAPWIAIPPGLSIVFLVWGFNLLSDGLRDILDPKMKDIIRQ
ncbi:MAG: ABC transporter permease [Actinobacteria bacterium]|nr:ABC transporter permease [Actinomycetota bacterium]